MRFIKKFFLPMTMLFLINAIFISGCNSISAPISVSSESAIEDTLVLSEGTVEADIKVTSEPSLIEAENFEGMPPDIKKIINRGKLIVGVYSEDRPPFFMQKDNSELYGFDISLAKDIASYLRVGIEFNREAATFNELTDMLVKGKVDMVVSKFSKTFDRAKLVRFSKTYINLKRALLVNRVQALKLKIEDYPMDFLREAEFKIGVVEGTSFVEYSKEMFKNATIVQYKHWEQAVDAMVKGEILVALYDDNEVIKLVRKKPDIALYASVFVLKDQKDSIAIAVPWQSTQLLSWLNDYLDAFEIQKDVNALIKDYPEIYKESSDN